jgi:hypothetical protein
VKENLVANCYKANFIGNKVNVKFLFFKFQSEKINKSCTEFTDKGLMFLHNGNSIGDNNEILFNFDEQEIKLWNSYVRKIKKI